MAVFALLLSLCVQSKNVTIFVIEEVTNRTGPPYDYAANITNLEENSVLIDVMNNAANYSNLTYAATLSDPCGWYINDINGLTVNSTHYWQILTGKHGVDFATINLGGRTSNYYPGNGEEILFRLAKWDGPNKTVTLNVIGDSMNSSTNVTGGSMNNYTNVTGDSMNNYTNVTGDSMSNDTYDMVYVISSLVNATLIDVMNNAVAETNFTYNATFGKYGYFITSINGLTATYPQWWHILDGDMISIPVGASCYVPENGEHILFKFDETEVEVAEDTDGMSDELILVVVLIVVFVVSIVIAVLCKMTLK